MRTFFVLFATCLAFLSLGQDSLYLEYSGKRLGISSSPVHCKIIKTKDGLFIESSDPNATNKYLELGGRSLLTRHSKGDTGAIVLIADAGFTGISHIPHIPTLGMQKGAIDHRKAFAMLTGGTTANVSTDIFTLPITRYADSGNVRVIEALSRENVFAKVTQSSIFKEGALEIPKKSSESYKDGRGAFSYEWILTKVQKGDMVPSLPTFEEFIGNVAVVQDERRSPPFSFSFSKGMGTFDEQYKKGEEIRASLERQGKADNNSIITAATVAGGFTLIASFILLRRQREVKA